jgi:hypothetical protein
MNRHSRGHGYRLVQGFGLSSRPALRLTAAVALAGIVTSAGLANVTVNDWNSPTSFHHKRIGVPDQDQKRVGLPNQGACYCAPTSYVNMMIYIANYGYPQVEPGPGVYTGYDNYYAVTNLLEELGAAASISPGGADPDDPDCNGDGFNDGGGDGGDGSDGECGNLPCGGSVTNTHNAFLDFGYFGGAEDDLIFIAKSLDPSAPATSFNNLAAMAIDGAIMEICFGRYSPVGETSGGTTIYRRGGGHCVTVNGIDRELNDMTLSIRDPASDEGDIFGPSPYATTVWDITNILVLTTSDDPDEGPIVNTAWKVLPAINEPHDDGKKRLVDGYFAIKPKSGVFWKDLSVINDLPLSVGFGPLPQPHPAPLAPILDLVQDEHDIGWFVLSGVAGGPTQLLKIDPIADDSQALGLTTATQLVLNRFDDLYGMSQTPPQIERRLSDGTVVGSVPIAGIPRAIACDDERDLIYVVVPGTSGFGGTIYGYPRSLGLDGAPVHAWPVLSTVAFGPFGSVLRAAVSPADGRLWIASEATDKAFAFNIPVSPRGPIAVAETIGGFGALTSIDFDDSGRMYTVDGGSVEVYERSATGGWQAGDASAFANQEIGSRLRISKSRSNHDRELHETDSWRNLDTSELEQMGPSIPDCVGDLNADGLVDAADLALLLGAWGGAGIGDLDLSGAVGAEDLAILLGAWGDC